MGVRVATVAFGFGLLGDFAHPALALDLDAVLREVAARPDAPVAREGAAKASRERETEEIANERYGEAWRVYVEAYFAQMLVRLHEERRTMLEHLVQGARSAYRAGRGAYVEVLAAEAAHSGALADLSAAVGESRVARAHLDMLLRRTPGGKDDVLLPPPIPDVPSDASVWTEAAMPEAELRSHVLATHVTARHAQRRARLIADTVVVFHERAFDAAWNAYGAGELSLHVTLAAAEALFEQKRSLLLARRDVALAQARFVALTGRADVLGVTLLWAESATR